MWKNLFLSLQDVGVHLSVSSLVLCLGDWYLLHPWVQKHKHNWDVYQFYQQCQLPDHHHWSVLYHDDCCHDLLFCDCSCVNLIQVLWKTITNNTGEESQQVRTNLKQNISQRVCFALILWTKVLWIVREGFIYYHQYFVFLAEMHF